MFYLMSEMSFSFLFDSFFLRAWFRPTMIYPFVLIHSEPHIVLRL